MSTPPRPHRRLLTTLGSVTAAAALALGVSTMTPADAHHAQPPGPVHAGSEYGWGKPQANYKFVGHLPRSQWRVKGPGAVRNQHGMLTLNTADHGTVSARQVTGGHEVGRWEIRLRSRQYGSGHHAYRVMTELVPAGDRKQYCGAKNVALETYAPHHHSVTHYIRSRPDHRYRMHQRIGLHDDQWHTFAVEVTHRRISWFVDAHVVSTEKRKDALTGTRFAVKFTMQGVHHARMNKSRMQMDWLRYWNLSRKDSKSTRAPSPQPGTYRDAC
ncbi:family 16 glycosylhydrolase [Nocardioides panaciterrulae]|uniref:Glycosyl hydrolase family protein n=1 Tax=Nocardioides panaciterrulae TaxID=661492 RepID=A0A7Y9E3M4_9ACTN|nr:family 16 glycosylhydrolase [Nocardioides panaciterrulae]NYD40340.1 hypothetical protein [Nocardioides panaciterrulae]